MKHYTLVTLAIAGLLSLPACSNRDEPAGGSTHPHPDEIRFSATTQRDSRSGDITTNNLKEFNVYAYMSADKSTFMDNVTVTKGSDNVWTYSPVKYWPDGALDFYAFAPASWVPATGPLQKIPYTNGGTEDIVYAVSLNRTQPDAGHEAQVKFNFRHALAKVNVLLSSSNGSLSIHVANVTLVGISHKGSFSFPADGTDVTGPAATPSSVGSWSDLSEPYAYPLLFAQDAGEIMVLNSTPTDVNQSGAFAQYMIPQQLSWSDGSSHTTDDYIQIDFSIYDPQTGARIWPNKNTPPENLIDESTNNDGRVKFPLSSATVNAWQPGYHYVYNVSINGHHDIGQIEFGDPTVDSFIEVSTDYEFTGNTK